MKKEFQDQWGIILGGSSGLGLASAKKLASHGMNILIVHRDRKSNLDAFQEEVARMKNQGIEVKTFNKDLLKSETIQMVTETLREQSVRVLLHSVAKGTVKPMHAKDGDILSTEDLALTINAMGLSWYEWTSALIENKSFSLNARNLAFTSEGNTKAIPSYGAVSAAKATLESIMRQMAVAYAPLGIRTNCVQAGVTQTPSFKIIPGSEQIAKWAHQRNPFHRLTTPEDVGNAVYLLCKEEADWINGTIVKVDGGESLR